MIFKLSLNSLLFLVHALADLKDSGAKSLLHCLGYTSLR